MRDRDDLSNEREFLAVRARLLVVLAIATGFLLGAAAGAVGYAKAGLAGLPLAVLIVGALAVWRLFATGGREYPATGRAASRAAREPQAAPN